MIFSGEIKKDEIYSLNKFAETLGISKTPVRDALQKLCNEKRIDLLPSRGFRIHKIDENELFNRYHFSIAIEGYCARVLAENKDTEPFAQRIEGLGQLVAQMEEADVDNMSFGDFYRLDNDFHNGLMHALGGTAFQCLADANLGFPDHPELHMTSIPLDRHRILAFHKDILAAIRSGDTSAVHKASKTHADYNYGLYKLQYE